MNRIEMDIVCQSCDGTGLYIGMAERDGAAVVCRKCKGTGKYHYKFEYEPFVIRKVRKDVKRVFADSIGFVHTPEDIKRENDGLFIPFSQCGCDYIDWLNGAKPKPVEVLYCPIQWSHQEKKPSCCISLPGNHIPSCRANKAECWRVFKEEYPDYQP